MSNPPKLEIHVNTNPSEYDSHDALQTCLYKLLYIVKNTKVTGYHEYSKLYRKTGANLYEFTKSEVESSYQLHNAMM